MNSRCWFATALALLLTLFLAAAPPAAAADYLKTTTEMEPFTMQGAQQPARYDTSEVWLSKDKAALITNVGQTFVLRSDLGQMYYIDNTTKTYIKVPVDFMSKLNEAIAEINGPDTTADTTQQKARTVFDDMQVTVKPIDSTRKVGKWNTKLYDITISLPSTTINTKSWNTTDIDIDLSLYESVASAVLASMPGFEKMLAKMSQAKGAPVESITTVETNGATVKSTSRLLEYVKKDAPPGIFDIPEGYTQDTTSMGAGMGGR